MSSAFARCSECSALLDDVGAKCPRCGHVDETAGAAEAGAGAVGVAVASPVAERRTLPPLQDAPPYRASGRSDAGALSLMARSGLIAALVIGVIYGVVTHYFNLFLIFPLLAGLGVGGVIATAAKKKHCRAPVSAALIGLLAGVLAYVVQYGVDIYTMRPEMVRALSQRIAEDEGMPLPAATALVERRLDLWRTLRLGTRIKVDAGVSISHTGSGGGGFSVSGNGYLVLILIEALLMGGTAAAVAVGAARSPYCESCREWQKESVVFQTNPARVGEVVQAARAQDWAALGRIAAQSPGADKSKCDVSVFRCDQCRDARLQIKTQSGNSAKRWVYATLPADAVDDLRRLGKLPAAPPGGSTATAMP